MTETVDPLQTRKKEPETEKPFWDEKLTLGDYSQLLDDYDVAAVEEEAMKAEPSYGW